MITLPEVNSDSKTILVYTKPICSAFVLLQMKKVYGNLDNVIMMYYPFVEMFQHYLGLKEPSSDFAEVYSDHYTPFVELCQEFGISDKIMFRDLDDVTFQNGDNLVKDCHRLDLYIDTINLAKEKNINFIYDVSSIVIPRSKDIDKPNNLSKENIEHILNSNDKLYNPLENIMEYELLEMVDENEIDIMRKYSEFEMPNS